MSFTKAKNYVSTSARFPTGSVNILRIPRLVSNFWKQNTQVQAIKVTSALYQRYEDMSPEMAYSTEIRLAGETQ